MTKSPRPFRDRALEKSLFDAVEIGVAVLKKYHRRLASVEKKGRVDLVTQADREAEARVLDYLSKRHPGHALIGEETWRGERAAPAGFAWVLDPVDGTTNYAHGLDHHALSLGLLLDGEPVAGVVANPGHDHLYHARRGGGAFRDRTRLHVSTKSRMVDSLIATGFPYDRTKRIDELTRRLGAFLSRCQDIRRFGVASLDLALVAAGQFDGYYEGPLNAWDIAAGVLLVTEAGGKISDYKGKPLDLFHPWMVASNGLIHAAMVKIIKDTEAG